MHHPPGAGMNPQKFSFWQFVSTTLPICSQTSEFLENSEVLAPSRPVRRASHRERRGFARAISRIAA